MFWKQNRYIYRNIFYSIFKMFQKKIADTMAVKCTQIKCYIPFEKYAANTMIITNNQTWIMTLPYLKIISVGVKYTWILRLCHILVFILYSLYVNFNTKIVSRLFSWTVNLCQEHLILSEYKRGAADEEGCYFQQPFPALSL